MSHEISSGLLPGSLAGRGEPSSAILVNHPGAIPAATASVFASAVISSGSLSSTTSGVGSSVSSNGFGTPDPTQPAMPGIGGAPGGVHASATPKAEEPTPNPTPSALVSIGGAPGGVHASGSPAAAHVPPKPTTPTTTLSVIEEGPSRGWYVLTGFLIALGVLGVGAIGTYFGIHDGMTIELGAGILTAGAAVAALAGSILCLASKFEKTRNKVLSALAILIIAGAAFAALNYIPSDINLISKIKQGISQLHTLKDMALVGGMIATPLLVAGIIATIIVARRREEACNTVVNKNIVGRSIVLVI